MEKESSHVEAEQKLTEKGEPDATKLMRVIVSDHIPKGTPRHGRFATRQRHGDTRVVAEEVGRNVGVDEVELY